MSLLELLRLSLSRLRTSRLRAEDESRALEASR